ncbi:site-specific integrase [Oceanihabitans sp. IOP_32]|nr:site-specific integrase [Oceanihabitans sp. IOP_32]QFZ53927.1 site-specific integrase [Oceanihabitans sp. IOP_32]QFZ53934.1 site-specific integrase [Oceanihabitans sp. IOP_32]
MRIGLFTKWLKFQGLTLKTIDYKGLLSYIGDLQTQEKSKTSINTTLRSIEHYYTFLQIRNIALNVRLRGTYQEQILLLSEEELLQIYSNYQNTTKHGYFKYSNKLILGLMIFQALDKQDIMNLALKDIDLTKGTFQVPAGVRRKNERIIQLEAHQIIPLHDYIINYRGIGRNGKKSLESSERLFHPNVNKEQRIHDQLKALAKAIRVQNPDLNFKRLTQLKQSRIGIWIDLYGLRKTQYLAGYKDVGNIEKYRNKDMKNLSKQIEMFHPLN